MISTFDRRLWILLLIILIQCIITTKQQNNIIAQKSTQQQQQQQPAARWSQTTRARADESFVAEPKPPSPASSAAATSEAEAEAEAEAVEAATNTQWSEGDNNRHNNNNNSNNNHNNHVANYQSNLLLNAHYANSSSSSSNNNNKQLKTKILNSEKCAKDIPNPYDCLKSKESSTIVERAHRLSSPSNITRKTTTIPKPTTTTTTTTTTAATFHALSQLQQHQQTPNQLRRHQFPKDKPTNQHNNNNNHKPFQMPSMSEQRTSQMINPAKQPTEHQQQHHEHQKVHIAHRQQHKEVHEKASTRKKHSLNALNFEAQQAFRARRDLDEEARSSNEIAEESSSINEGSRSKKTPQSFREDRNARKLHTSHDGEAAPDTKQAASSDEDEEATASIPASASEPASVVAAAKDSGVAVEGSDGGSADSVSAAAQLNGADALLFASQDISGSVEDLLASQLPPRELLLLPTSYYNESDSTQDTSNQSSTVENAKDSEVSAAAKRTRSASVAAAVAAHQPSFKKHEPFIIIDDAEEFDSGTDRLSDDKSDDYAHDEPRVLALRPLLPSPYDDVHAEEMSVVYAEQHTEIRLMCEVDLDIATSVWYKNGLVVHAMDRTSRVTDYRFIKETNGGLTITNVMLEDDGKWQCEAENTRAYVENARPVKLVVLDRPKPPYLLIDSRRLDAGNIFVPVKENSELNLACISEGGNPKPTLTWEVLLSPGVDRHAQKVSAEVLELQEVKSEKDKQPYKINGGAKSEARLPAVYRAHHNARILCVMEHPTLKIRQNASLLLDVQYTPSFAISRTPGFGYPLREGIEVSLKCDVDSNPPSTPRWQKDDGDTPVPQTGDGFLNFSSIRREHSGWYKCTSRHLNFQYSSIGYYLSVRYDSVDVTSEPDDQDISVAAASHNPNKGQLEVQLGGAVTLQCPQGSLGCWSHLDPVTARLRGLGQGLSTPTGQFSLKDVVYQDAGTYKCIGQSVTNKKKLEVLQTVGVAVKGAPTVMARNATPVAYPGSPLHLSVEFCANPPAHAARWLHGDRVFTPGNQYGSTVLAYGVTDLPTPYCKEARLTYVSMHERVPRTFYFIVSSPGGVAEAMFKVNFTMRYRTMSNTIDDEEEELSEPEEIHFPVFGSGGCSAVSRWLLPQLSGSALLLLLLLRWTGSRSTHL